MERKNIWNLYSDEQISELKEINDKYKRCLDAGKTERECVELSVNMARDAGYRDLEEILRSGETLKAGDKVYAVNMNKMLALFRIGERPISEGMNILGAHIDSPRIDVKQNPLYENKASILFILGGTAARTARRHRQKERRNCEGIHRRR